MSSSNQNDAQVSISKKRPAEDEESTGGAVPITQDGERPQKKFYRQRAHCNPLAHNDSYDYPARPKDMQWIDDQNLYPATRVDKHKGQLAPTVLDIGCGFGGLTMALAPLLPDEVILGMGTSTIFREWATSAILSRFVSYTLFTSLLCTFYYE